MPEGDNLQYLLFELSVLEVLEEKMVSHEKMNFGEQDIF